MNASRQRAGSVMVELALVLTLFVPMLLGAIHFGYLFYLYNGLEKSVRDGARYAASRTLTSKASFERVVEAIVVCGTYETDTKGNITCGATGGASPTVPGLEIRANPTDPSKMVSVTLIPDTPGVRPARIRVAIQNYQYRGVLSNILDRLLPDGNPNPCACLTLTGKPALEVPYFGRYAP